MYTEDIKWMILSKNGRVFMYIMQKKVVFLNKNI